MLGMTMMVRPPSAEVAEARRVVATLRMIRIAKAFAGNLP